jgi:hypothetical protein
MKLFIYYDRHIPVDQEERAQTDITAFHILHGVVLN